jgi:hypothetical protein
MRNDAAASLAPAFALGARAARNAPLRRNFLLTRRRHARSRVEKASGGRNDRMISIDGSSGVG